MNNLHLGAGLSFKPEYFAAARDCVASGLWYEVHAENYLVAGGARLAMLDAMAAHHPISVHGVGLSLASATLPDAAHLQRVAQLVSRAEACVVSEHLAWSVFNGHYFPDLLPVPRTRETLQALSHNIDMMQSVLRRQVLIENPSAYLRLDHEYSEADFLCELVRRSGCGLLVDVNNAYVSAHNVGGDAMTYLQALPAQAIGEIHLAGHAIDAGGELLIDTHDAPVTAAVWALYAALIDRIGPRPTLIERDANLPAFTELLLERQRAASLLESYTELAHVRHG